VRETTPVLTGVAVGDDPAGWRAAGFEVDGRDVVVGGVTVRLLGADAGGGILRWSLSPPASGPVDGLAPFGPQERTETPHAATTAHANGAVGLDHLVVTTDDLERTTSALGEIGLTPRRTVVGIRGEDDDEVAYRFFLLGTCVLELVGPTTPTGDGPARFAGLAFTSDHVESLGDIAGAARDAVQPGRRIATLRGRELGVSVPIAFLSPRPERSRSTAREG
jgi:hypothetical protein